MATTLARIEFRRKTAAQWTSSNEVLLASEPGVETDTGKFKLGDGTTGWSSLPYQAGTAASLAATTVTLWKANTAYAAGQAVLNPSGQVVTALAGFTSGSSYDASNWSTPASGGAAIDDTTTSTSKVWSSSKNAQISGLLVPLSTSNTGAQNSSALVAANTSAATFGAAMTLPPGTYSLDPTVLTPRDRMTIRGAGAAYQNGVGTKLVNTSSSGGDLLSITGGDSSTKAWTITVEDFELGGIAGSGNGLVLCSPGTTGIILGNVTVRRISSHGHGASGFKAQGRIDQLHFEQCIARDNTAHGYDLTTFNLLSEVTLLQCHGSSNTDHGLYVGGTVFACTVLGGEYSSNGQIGYEMSSAPGGNANSFTAIGVHSEKNAVYHAQFGSNSVNSVVLDGCHFLDNTTSGITTLINIRVRAPGSMVVRNCTASGKLDQTVLVAETGNGRIPDLAGSAITTTSGTAYLRKTSTGTYTNDWKGGTTADLPSVTYSRTSDTYYDTTAAQTKRFASGAWSAISSAVGTPGSTGAAGVGSLQRAGFWHRTGSAYSTSSSFTNNAVMAQPFQAQKALTLDQMSVEITTAGQAGATIRLGVYADDGTGSYPASLLVDGGTVAGDATGSPTVTLGTPVSLAAGTLYWLVAVVQNAATTRPTMRSVSSVLTTLPFGTTAPSSAGGSFGWLNNGVSGALPGTFTATTATTGTVPAVGYHLT